LECALLALADVLRLVDDTHAAAKLFENTVMTKNCACPETDGLIHFFVFAHLPVPDSCGKGRRARAGHPRSRHAAAR
jgi:hypothetical protein